MRAVIHMRGIYGGTFSQTKEFKNDKHLDNWLKFMDKNQDKVKVIGTKTMGKFMQSRFKSTCAETGIVIKKGESIYFDGKAYCSRSNAYQKANEPTDIGHVEAQENAYFDNFCLRNNI